MHSLLSTRLSSKLMLNKLWFPPPAPQSRHETGTRSNRNGRQQSITTQGVLPTVPMQRLKRCPGCSLKLPVALSPATSFPNLLLASPSAVIFTTELPAVGRGLSLTCPKMASPGPSGVWGPGGWAWTYKYVSCLLSAPILLPPHVLSQQ